jgi:hypothetical protein
MPENGYYPILLTRKWTGKELTERERLFSSGQDLEILQDKNGEIHYLPYFASLRDKLFLRSEYSKWSAVGSKFFTLIELVFRNLLISFIPYNNMYRHARMLLKQDLSLRTVIISGNPFEQFYFGYLLKKEFPDLHWVADYRDEWTSSEINNFGFIRRMINTYDVYFEKKWVSNASLITANTKYATKKLAELHHKEVQTITNGFEFDKLPAFEPSSNKNELVIVHNGTLYPTQKITLLKNALKRVQIPENFQVKLKFPGLLIKKDVAEYVNSSFDNLSVVIEMSDRVPQESILRMQLEADLLLMVAHENKKGVVGSKLYEYIGLEKPVLLCPSDNDELEETLKEVGSGLIASKEDELLAILEKLIKEKRETGKIYLDYDKKSVSKYHRANQVRKLTNYLNDLND